MFGWGIVALNYAWLVDVKIPWLDGIFGSNNSAVVEPSSATWTATWSELILPWGVETILCEGTLNPEKQPDGSFVCIESQPLKTECMDPEWEARKDGSKLTFYKVTEKTTTNTKPTCESIEKICVNGNFAPQWSTDPSEKSEYKFLECKVIDRTDVALTPCKDDDWTEVPVGSTRIRFLKNEIASDEECRHIEEFCNAKWTWISNFPTHTMVKCDFKWSFTTDYMKQNPEIFSTNGELKPEAEWKITIDSSKPSCTTPWWESIKHGEKFISFEEKVVRFAEECVSRTHTCIDGKIEYIEPFKYSTCKIEWPDNCVIDETNVTVYHDSSRELYNKWKYSNGKWTCDSQTRTCNDGTLDGDSAYIYLSCWSAPKAVTSGPARCPSPYVWESAVLDHGRQWVWYFKNSVWRFDSCDGEVDGKVNKVTVTCQYGTIQPIGNSVKIWRSCTKWTPKDCRSPRWTSVPHGQSITAFVNGSPSYGTTCKPQTRVCNDWVLGWSYEYEKCIVWEPNSCIAPWWSTVAHGWSVVAYQTDTTPYGKPCPSQTRSCTNGTLAGSYVYQSCRTLAPADCNYQGSTIAHGATVTRATAPKIIWDPLEGRSECSWYSAKCNNGTMEWNLLNHPEATNTACNAPSLSNG